MIHASSPTPIQRTEAVEVTTGEAVAEVTTGEVMAGVAIGEAVAEVAIGEAVAEVTTGEAVAEVTTGEAVAEVTTGEVMAGVAIGEAVVGEVQGPLNHPATQRTAAKHPINQSNPEGAGGRYGVRCLVRNAQILRICDERQTN
jgi:hypothetical protein